MARACSPRPAAPVLLLIGISAPGTPTFGPLYAEMGRQRRPWSARRFEWWKLGRQVGGDELEDRLSDDQVFEAVDPQRAQQRSGRQRVAHQLLRRVGE